MIAAIRIRVARTALQGNITSLQIIARCRNRSASSLHGFIDSSSKIVESEDSYTDIVEVIRNA
jgi:hypothetical protein